MSYPEDQNLTPEQAEVRMRILTMVTTMMDHASVLDLLSAEDVFSVIEEVALMAACFFSEEFWTTRYRNSEIIAGETDTSIGTTTSGTVSSKKIPLYKKRIIPGDPALKQFFSELASVVGMWKAATARGDRLDTVFKDQPFDLLKKHPRGSNLLTPADVKADLMALRSLNFPNGKATGEEGTPSTLSVLERKLRTKRDLANARKGYRRRMSSRRKK